MSYEGPPPSYEGINYEGGSNPHTHSILAPYESLFFGRTKKILSGNSWEQLTWSSPGFANFHGQ